MNEESKSQAVLNPARSGVYCTPPHVEAVRQRIAEAALWVEADIGAVRSKRELLDAIAEVFGFPPEFGRNWDALADALQDLSWLREAAYVLRLREAARAARALGAEWSTFIEVLSHVALYWQSRDTPFVVLVDDIPELPPWM